VNFCLSCSKAAGHRRCDKDVSSFSEPADERCV
jgi:hypothetical protein